MTDKSSRRFAAASGFLFLALFVAHRIVQGPGPLQGRGASLDPSSAAIAAYFTEHRTAVLVAAYLNELGILFLILFVGGLAGAVRRSGDQVMADVVLGGGLLFAAMGLVTSAAQTALAWVAGEGDPNAVRGLFDLQAAVPVTIAIAAFVGATALAVLRTRILSRWLGVVGLAATLVFLAGAAGQSGIATSGFFAPKGSAALVGAALFVAWVLAVCVALSWRCSKPDRVDSAV
ncbi:MAG: hypothetical protein ACRDZ4_16815 [Egibacteraceae bacterium]